MRSGKPTYIYAALSRDGATLKVGISVSPWIRRSQLDSRFGQQFDIVTIRRGTAQDERRILRASSAFLKSGREWFTPDQSILDMVRSLPVADPGPEPTRRSSIPRPAKRRITIELSPEQYDVVALRAAKRNMTVSSWSVMMATRPLARMVQAREAKRQQAAE